MRALFGMRACVILLLLFALFSAAATLFESSNSSDFAWHYFYNAWYFELLQLWLGVALCFNLKRLFHAKSWPAFIFHLAFIFILIGSICTRYFGFEGSLHLRQGESSDEISSFSIHIELKAQDKSADIFQYISANSSNNYELKLDLKKGQARLKSKEFLPNAGFIYESSTEGEPILLLRFFDEEHDREIAINEGQKLDFLDYSLSFGEEAKRAKFINIFIENKSFYLKSSEDLSYIKPMSLEEQSIRSGEALPLEEGMIFTIKEANLSFSPQQLLLKGERKIAKNKGANDALLATLSYQGQEEEVYFFLNDKAKSINLAGEDFSLSWAAKTTKLPFAVKLDSFKVERHPGSFAPADYKSLIEINGAKHSVNMNNVLDYEGLRFFQSSFDKDELGSYLTVSKDPGRYPSYLGYALLCFGLAFNLLNKRSRLRRLLSFVNKSSLMILLLATLPLYANESLDELKGLVVQGSDGRLRPFDTLARELMDKIHSGKFRGEDPAKSVLSMLKDAQSWKDEELIKIKDIGPLLGLDARAKYARFSDFYDFEFKYKLKDDLEAANSKPQSRRSLRDRELIKADERLNVFYMIFRSEILKIIPENGLWHAPSGLFMQDRGKVFAALNKFYSKDEQLFLQGLRELKSLQEERADFLPSKSLIEQEILYNKLHVFKSLILPYLFLGLLLFALSLFATLRKVTQRAKALASCLVFGIFLCFLAHSAALMHRYLISGHMPWTNAYESMVYIAYSLALAGLVLRKNTLAPALSSIMAAIALFVAHLNASDAQITQLAPVLNSYWLSLHVAIITASYGFFGLCFLLGMSFWLLKIIQPKLSFIKITALNEASMILGLSLLVVGNFFGAIWANESWGRYWGWDSKETWSLICILVYSAILHLRLAHFRSAFLFASCSVFAFFCVLMTYFGVNFYLTGLHSYGSSEAYSSKMDQGFLLFALFVIFMFLSSFLRSRRLRLS